MFNVLAIRTGEEPASSLYPRPGDDNDSVQFEQNDGSVQAHGITALRSVRRARGGNGGVLGVRKIDGLLYITDSRLAIACSQYEKGGGWIGFGVGGLAAAVVANVVSRSLAKRRIKGTMLVGHVRYEWLHQVYGSDRAGPMGRNTLSFIVQEPAGGIIDLTITLDRSSIATSLATEIARRAARYPVQRRSRRTSFDSGTVEYWLTGSTSVGSEQGGGQDAVDELQRVRLTSELLLVHHS